MQFGIGHPPTYTSIAVYMCGAGGSRVPNLQTEFNYLDLFKSYGIFSDFVVPVVPMSSPCCPHHPHGPPKVPMWSPWLWSPWSPPLSPPHVVPMVPVIPTLSLSSLHHLEGPHIIPNPPTHSTHPPPPGGGGPRISKSTIRF